MTQLLWDWNFYKNIWKNTVKYYCSTSQKGEIKLTWGKRWNPALNKLCLHYIHCLWYTAICSSATFLLVLMLDERDLQLQWDNLMREKSRCEQKSPPGGLRFQKRHTHIQKEMQTHHDEMNLFGFRFRVQSRRKRKRKRWRQAICHLLASSTIKWKDNP